MKTVLKENEGRIELQDDTGAYMGQIDFEIKGRDCARLVAAHTELCPGSEGRGLGKILLEALVAYARKKGATIKPVCPYVKAMFEKYPERYADVILPPRPGPAAPRRKS